MVSKAELVKIAIERNIRFKKTWSKEQIETAIASGVTNDALWVACKISGLKFDCVEWEVSDRTEVHPTISWWKKQACKRGWYARFFEAIEHCQEKGYDLAGFEKVLRRASDNLPFEEEDEKPYNLALTDMRDRVRKAWVAKVVGVSAKYDFDREFVEGFVEGHDNRDRKFHLTEEGIYEWCSYSSKGNATRKFIEVVSGGIKECSRDRVIEVFGDPEALKRELALSTSTAKEVEKTAQQEALETEWETIPDPSFVRDDFEVDLIDV